MMSKFLKVISTIIIFFFTPNFILSEKKLNNTFVKTIKILWFLLIPF